MDVAILKVYSQASVAEKCKIEIRPAVPFVQESTVDPERTDKNKVEFITVLSRYRSSMLLSTMRAMQSKRKDKESRIRHKRMTLQGKTS